MTPGTTTERTTTMTTTAVQIDLYAAAAQVAHDLDHGNLDTFDVEALDTDEGMRVELPDGTEAAVWTRDDRVVAGTQPDLDGPEFWAEVTR